MRIQELFSRLNRQGIRLEVVDNNLKINAPKGKLTPALVKQLREKKQEIITFLQSHAREREKYSLVEAVEKKEYYHLSSAQKRIYIIQQMDLQVIAYNMPLFLELFGEFDRDKFTGAFRRLIARHESLRTSFHMLEDEPVQRINEEVEFKVEVEERDQRTEDRGQTIEFKQAAHLSSVIRHLSSEFVSPFDLTRAPLLRVGLIKIGKHRHILMVDTHHIVADGVSREVFIKDFISLYQEEELPRLPVQYKDFTGWQNREKHKDGMKRQEEYWLKEFNDEIPVLNLPVDFVRPPEKCFAGSTVDFEINPEESKELKKLAREEDATLFMVLLAIYNIFLSKISGQDDIVIGTPVSGRGHSNLQRLTGMFVNTLALRNAPNGAKSFKEFLKQLSERTLDAFENRDYQFEDLVEQVAVQRDANRNPVFDTMFVLENMEIAEIKIPGLNLKTYDYQNVSAKFDLMLTAVEAGKNLQFAFEYCTGLFKKETIRRFIGYLNKIISTVLENYRIRPSGIEIINEEEKNRILYEFNDTEAEYPRDKTIHRLFEEQVERTPDRVALTGQIPNSKSQIPKNDVPFGQVLDAFSGGHLSYKELNNQSNRLAGALIEKGVQPDTIVGIMMERTIEMVIGIFGILKAGGAYLPIDVDYPEERISYMLVDSSTKILLTTPNLSKKFEKLSITNCQLLMVNENPPVRRKLNTHPKEANLINNYQLIINNLQLEQAQMAYIIYTSGSTGKPKGVLVEHRNAVNTVNWFVDIHKVGKDTRILQLSDYTFDASVNQIFGTLISGASLYIAPKEVRSDIEKLRYYIIYHRINIINFVPTFLKEMLCYVDKLESLHTVISGAEKLDEIAKESIIGKGYRLVNQYGPTETAIDALVLECSSEKVSLGKPISNVRVYILDKYENVLPIGVVGELYITGAGVTRGYLNRPGLTAEKFLISHLSLVIGSSTNDLCPMTNDRLYRTGDLARWLQDGNIEFLGRIDHQVKIRGFRIELEEIENRLSTHEKINEAVVIAMEDNNDKSLCAYMVAKPGETNPIDQSGLREYLSNRLPDYMIPAYFVQLDNIPLTPNGKVDRKALPEPEKKAGKNYIAPRNETEKKLADIWSEILDVEKEKIGIYDNFFHLGGHSLKATVLVSRMHKELNINVPLSKIFKTPHIRGLASYIKERTESKSIPVEPVEKKEYYPLSSAQRRFYILHQMDAEGGTGYNIPSLWQVEGNLDAGKFERVFRQLIRRHESLRTFFTVVNDEPVQRINEENPKFEIRNWKQFPNSNVQNPGQKLIPDLRHFIRPFDLFEAPLLRVGLIHTPSDLRPPLSRGEDTPAYGHQSQKGISGDKHILMLDMHHIISDGLSMDIFIRDFIGLYTGKRLPALKLQYKDYAQWLGKQVEKGRIKQQEDYWLNQFEDEVPILHLPIDFSRPSVQDFEGRTLHFVLYDEDNLAVKQLAHREGTTLFMTLLAFFSTFLAKITGQEDLVIGIPIVCRNHADLVNIIGLFINILALRIFPVPGKTFMQILTEGKEQSTRAFENSDYPFEELVKQVEGNRDSSRNPIFDVMLTMQNPPECDLEIPCLKLKPYEFENRISKLDLSLQFTENEAKVFYRFEYSTKLFRTETVEAFVRYFKTMVSAILKEPGQKLSDVEILPEAEKKHLLIDLNETGAGYAGGKIIPVLFEEQASLIPDKTAVRSTIELQNIYDQLLPEDIEVEISYKELNENANQLAHVLREQGVEPDSVVGLMVEHPLEKVAGIWGILKSGGAYLPIDPTYPRAVTRDILWDSQVRWLVSETALGDCLSAPGIPGHCNVIFIDEIESRHSLSKPICTASMDNLAYIIYTSGTTGKPKGTAVEHKGIVNYARWRVQYFDLTGDDTALQPLKYSFDSFCANFYSTFLSDGELVIVPDKRRLDFAYIAGLIREYRVTNVCFAPGLYNTLLEAAGEGDLHSMRLVVLAGEASGPALLRKSREKAPHVRIANEYGPTEGTVAAACNPEIKETTVNIIGSPIVNAKIYILNDSFQPVFPGAPGEVYIGGTGVTRGYLNRPELTAERFIAHELHELVEEKKLPLIPNTNTKTIYRTGDLARWMRDGNIEFLGRLDRQVKIRGIRIELGEIESRMLTQVGIKEAVVLAHEDQGGDKYLCAYVVFDREYETSELRECLSKELPDYMIPSYFVLIENIPLTPNGKIDSKKLPKPEIKASKEYTAPRNQVEKKLIEIWQDVLSLDREMSPGIDDNFFELGGHSLKATVMLSKIHRLFNVRVPLAKIFIMPTIRQLAQFIENSEKDLFEIKDDSLVLLRNKFQQARNLFCIHDGSGEVDGYVDFCQHLEADMNCWGIGAYVITDYAPRNLSIEEIASEYISKVKKVQPRGPYFIAGWCLGGTIAFEMGRQLEIMNEKVDFLALIDSPAPRSEIASQVNYFTVESERNWLGDYLTSDTIQEKIIGYSSIEEIWALIVDSQEEIPLNTEKVVESIPGIERFGIPDIDKQDKKELIRIMNRIRTFLHARGRYIPRGIIHTTLYFFAASQSDQIESRGWMDYCKKPIKFQEIQGDHFSILKSPAVSQLCRNIDKILNQE